MDDKNKNGIDDRYECIICLISSLSPIFLICFWLVAMGIYLVVDLDEAKADHVRITGNTLLTTGLALIGNGRRKQNGTSPS